MKDIFEIIRARDLEALKDFLEEYPRGLDVETPEGVWALHEVMAQGDLPMARFVTEYGIVNLNLTDRRGNTVLHYAVRSGNMELVRYLTERVDSPVDQANLLGETPLDWSVALGKDQIREYFEERLGACAEELYHNPIRRGMHPDPSIVRVGEDYYMVNSTFVFFPCIPVSHSRDLIHWQVIGYAITNSQWARLKGLEGGRGYWAPDISYYEGRFYITATYRLNEGGLPQRLQMVTSAERPEGPYCEPVFLEEEGIDPSIFTDLDGRRYMLLNRGARIFEISRDGKKILSEPKLLWYGQNKKASEGPHMIYKDGYYYLFMAEGGTGRGHRITVARSRELMGVYESCPYNPILRQWDEKRLIQCSGHGMPVETQNGDWYMVYLCSRISLSGYGILGRETCLDPIEWTADGWPLVHSLKGPSDLQKKPLLSDVSGEKADGALGIWKDWLTVRGQDEGSYERQGEDLLIHGNGRDLNTLEYGAVLVRRQQEFCFEVSGKVQIEPLPAALFHKMTAAADDQKDRNIAARGLKEDWDAGLTCYYDENSYLKLALAQRDGKRGVLASEYVDDGYVTKQWIPLESGVMEAEFKIVTEELKRTLYVRQDGGWRQAAILEDTSYLSSEGLKKGKRFTGAMAGIYVNGRVTARFSQFQMKNF